LADPLAEIVTLLQPGALFSKLVRASGGWRVRRSETGQVFYALMLSGTVRLELDGKPAITLQPSDFVLVPAIQDFSISSLDPPPKAGELVTPVRLDDGSYRIGGQEDPVTAQMLVGYCTFGSPDAALLVRLLPEMVVVRGENRLEVLARLVAGEACAERPGRDVVLARLLEVLLIETLRSSAETMGCAGILRGLADERLVGALRCLHADPARNWTVADLARKSGLSRSAFFERFHRKMGMPPIDYLLNWRISLAKDLLRRGRSIAEVARRVGYGSASAFSVAFSRQVGMPPARYAQSEDAPAP
jgi:AraC-like DNA-binding protein